tara:strand:- start:336 stop:533 length:198 start_codon:yes stop_codon:yes gene_type:complete
MKGYNKMKIKKDDLSYYFILDHKDLPQSYLDSCESFFNEIKQIKNPAVTYKTAVNKLKKGVKNGQ